MKPVLIAIMITVSASMCTPMKTPKSTQKDLYNSLFFTRIPNTWTMSKSFLYTIDEDSLKYDQYFGRKDFKEGLNLSVLNLKPGESTLQEFWSAQIRIQKINNISTIISDSEIIKVNEIPMATIKYSFSLKDENYLGETVLIKTKGNLFTLKIFSSTKDSIFFNTLSNDIVNSISIPPINDKN